MKKTIVVLIGASLLALGALALSGRVAVVSTHGVSMEPGFRAGDLAMLVATGDYQVGDVVAYRSAELDTIVMHRIVDREDDRYVLQGDNNDWLDPDRPSPDDVEGELALRIAGGGIWLRRLTSAPALGALAFGLLAGGGAAGNSRRRRRRGPVTATTSEARPRPALPAADAWLASSAGTSSLVAGVAAAAALALLGAVLLGVGSTQPAPLGPVEIVHTHEGRFAYAAAAPAGPVYPDGRVETGDTVFLQVVDEVEVSFEWRPASLDRGAPVDVSGTGRLLLDVADGSGWQRTIPLTDPVALGPEGSTMRADLDLGDIQRLVAAVQRATGATGSSQTLTLVADVDVEATVDGRPVRDEFQPSVAFTLDALRLQPQAPDGDGAFEVSEVRTSSVAGEGGPRAHVLGWTLPVPLARAAAGGLLLLAAVLGGVAWSLWRRLLRRGPDGRIEARYGRVMVETSGMAPAPGRTLVEVARMEDLVRLADRLTQPVLRVPLLDGSRAYVVDDGYTTYRHRPAAVGVSVRMADHLS